MKLSERLKCRLILRKLIQSHEVQEWADEVAALETKLADALTTVKTYADTHKQDQETIASMYTLSEAAAIADKPIDKLNNCLNCPYKASAVSELAEWEQDLSDMRELWLQMYRIHEVNMEHFLYKVEQIAKLEAENKAWRKRFPAAGYDGDSIILSG